MKWTRKKRFHQKIFFWIDTWPEKLWWAIDPAHRVVCFLLGHEPYVECHDPNHDRCGWCPKSMPGQAIRKVNQSGLE